MSIRILARILAPRHDVSAVYATALSSIVIVPASASSSTWMPSGSVNWRSTWPIIAPEYAGTPSGLTWSSSTSGIVSDPNPSPGLHLLARAPDDALHLAEDAGQLQLREHPVEAVRRFLHVLEEEDAVR